MREKTTKAQVGIGTLIIFIAMVLVAAVAAAVLIQTSGVLQQRAAQTGTQTTTEVASGIEIINIQGYAKDAPGGNISRLAITIAPASGTQMIDLDKTVVTISDGTNVRDFVYDSTMYANQTVVNSGGWNTFNTTRMNTTAANNSGNYYGMMYYDQSAGVSDAILQYPYDTAAAATYGQKFGIMVLKDADSSISSSTPTMNKGDKVILTINLVTNGMGLDPRTTVTGTIKPEYGAPAVISFVTPSAYVDKVITLQGA